VIHLQGMGVIGAFLANTLADRGVPFTWNDVEARHAAWPACTGAVFPTGDNDDLYGLAAWLKLRASASWAADVSCESVWCFTQKTPPHGGRYPYEPLSGPLKVARHPAVFVNAQRLVLETRKRFAGERRPPEVPRPGLVVTHGSATASSYVWGWMARVQLVLARHIPRDAGIYCREGRFTMAYAYPIPGSPGEWYAGSSLVPQVTPHALQTQKRLERWARDVERMTDGRVRCVSMKPPTMGWRPRGDDAAPRVRLVDGVVYVRPHWHNGVRHAPLIARDVLEFVT
jgi:hypothetical protein